MEPTALPPTARRHRPDRGRPRRRSVTRPGRHAGPADRRAGAGHPRAWTSRRRRSGSRGGRSSAPTPTRCSRSCGHRGRRPPAVPHRPGRGRREVRRRLEGRRARHPRRRSTTPGSCAPTGSSRSAPATARRSGRSSTAASTRTCAAARHRPRAARVAGGTRPAEARRVGQGPAGADRRLRRRRRRGDAPPARPGRLRAAPVLPRDAPRPRAAAARRSSSTPVCGSSRGRPTSTSTCGSRTTTRSATTGEASRRPRRAGRHGRAKFAPAWSFARARRERSRAGGGGVRAVRALRAGLGRARATPPATPTTLGVRRAYRGRRLAPGAARGVDGGVPRRRHASTPSSTWTPRTPPAPTGCTPGSGTRSPAARSCTPSSSEGRPRAAGRGRGGSGAIGAAVSAHGVDRGRQGHARAVAPRVDRRQVDRLAAGPGRTGRRRTHPGEDERVLALEEAVRPHAAGRAALARVQRERRRLARCRSRCPGSAADEPAIVTTARPAPSSASSPSTGEPAGATPK